MELGNIIAPGIQAMRWPNSTVFASHKLRKRWFILVYFIGRIAFWARDWCEVVYPREVHAIFSCSRRHMAEKILSEEL